MAEITDLIGKTLTMIERSASSKYSGDDVLTFTTTEGEVYKMWHYQDCCENVCIEDIVGDLPDLIGSPILAAEEASNVDPDADESGTWTFYKLATIKGSVTIRWYGSSNGYYSESVDFDLVQKAYCSEVVEPRP